MNRKLRAVVASLMLSAGVYGQIPQSSPPARLEFEVASIKAPPAGGGRRGFGGGKRILSDPAVFRTRNTDPAELVLFAYDMLGWQVKGLRDDLGRYDVTATTPFAASEAQERTMLRALLADRFHMASHYEPQKVKGYALVADKSSGLKPSAGDSEPGIRWIASDNRNEMTWEAKGTTLAELARWMSSSLSLPVRDESGIVGRFDFTLRVSANPDDAAAGNVTTLNMGFSDYRAAVRKLGLDLKPQIADVDMLVVDRLEKPSVN